MFTDLYSSSPNRLLSLFCLFRRVESLSRSRDTELTSARDITPMSLCSNSGLNFQGSAAQGCSATLRQSNPCPALLWYAWNWVKTSLLTAHRVWIWPTFCLTQGWRRAPHMAVGRQHAHKVHAAWTELNWTVPLSMFANQSFLPDLISVSTLLLGPSSAICFPPALIHGGTSCSPPWISSRGCASCLLNRSCGPFKPFLLNQFKEHWPWPWLTTAHSISA